MSKFNTTAAVAALNAWAVAATLAADAKGANGSAREAFAVEVIAGAKVMGRAAVDDIKAAFDAMPRDIKEGIKGGVTETFNIVKWVLSGNTIPARKNKKGELVHGAIACIADLEARPCPLSSIAKAWREEKGRMMADASGIEREETNILSLGLVALGAGDTYNGGDAYRAKAAGLDTYAGHTFADILAAGTLEMEAAEADARAERDKADAEAYRAEVIAFLKGLSGLERGDLLAEVMEGEILAITA